MYGLPAVSREFWVVPVAIGIENMSSLPITAVRLQIEYPAQFLVDSSVPGRTAQRYGSLAQIIFEMELLRPKEQVVLHELVRIQRRQIATLGDEKRQALVQSRWTDVPYFSSALELHLSVWAGNCDPAAMSAIVAVSEVTRYEELTTAADRFIASAWDERKRARGVRHFIWPWRRRSRLEHAELVFLPRDALIGKEELDPTILRYSRTALLQFVVPPWGLMGQPSDFLGCTKAPNANHAA
jgi:hypothetical protein